MLRLLILAITCFAATARANIPPYEVPKAKIDVFWPKGFEVSIPHEEGMTLFAFHGKLNEEMDGLEAGTWARDILKPKDGRWIFRDRNTKLKFGDTLYYWTYVIYNGLGYREDDGVFVVNEYTNRPGEITTPTPPPPSGGGNGDNKGHGGAGEIDVRIDESCKSTATTKNGVPQRCANQLLFDDDFTGSRLDKHHWTVEERFSRAPDHEFVLYLDNVPDVLKVQNGMVTIRPKMTKQHFQQYKNPLRAKHDLGARCTGRANTDDCVRDGGAQHILNIPPFISAQFSTKQHFTFKYGRVEIRAKLPRANWVFPQLWLEPKDAKYGVDNYQSGQMRIAFTCINNTQMHLYGGLILNANSPWRRAKMCEFNNEDALDLGNEFHTYSLTWKENEISVSVDGKQYCRWFTSSNTEEALTNLKAEDGQELPKLPNSELLKSGTKLAPFDQEFYITLGYGIAGVNDFEDSLYGWQPEKPWVNTEPRGMSLLHKKVKNDFDGWLQNGDLRIDYIRVYSI
ncbi:gram-negative bacteria-binding protein 3 [Rhagoletis pomonella]|uniref:gram-negative bacteria-binding protein 3 n=1 Tax=Rhagoletis pomonella TaxID=28610 RepID=UPI00177F6206|nr:gram-negative bacteria-binding protein 3 [Rhagoletis pomonella]